MYILKRKTKLEKILNKRMKYITLKAFIMSLTNKELDILGKEIIKRKNADVDYTEYESELAYYNSLHRWQRENYVLQRDYFLFG